MAQEHQDESTVTTKVQANYDVAVVGAGPIGAVAAAAYAKKGASVLLLEANPRAATRFAGEWIHPPGAAVLHDLGLAPLRHASRHPACEGFAVFPDDGSEAIQLPYAEGAQGVSCEHQKLVDDLREKVSALPGVDYLPYARVTEIKDGGNLVFQHKRMGEQQVCVERIVGADGRASVVRDYLKLPENSALISYMAGVDLIDTELPFEGFGHVLLGAPGPMLLYRTGPNTVKACIDLPLEHCNIRRDPKRLWDYFGDCLPSDPLRHAFRKALIEKRISWAATRFRPRACYGRGNTALVGDAVGHFHPLTATGMTIGFLDVQALVESPSVEVYQTRRESSTYVSELLASALYQVIVRDDASATALRSSIYRTWRGSETERTRTMRILAGDQTKPSQFGLVFAKVAVSAVYDAAAESVRATGKAKALPAKLASFAPWAQWPLSSIVPKAVRAASRGESTAWDPMHGLKRKFRRRGNSGETTQPSSPEASDCLAPMSLSRRDVLMHSLSAQELRLEALMERLGGLSTAPQGSSEFTEGKRSDKSNASERDGRAEGRGSSLARVLFLRGLSGDKEKDTSRGITMRGRRRKRGAWSKHHPAEAHGLTDSTRSAAALCAHYHAATHFFRFSSGPIGQGHFERLLQLAVDLDDGAAREGLRHEAGTLGDRADMLMVALVQADRTGGAPDALLEQVLDALLSSQTGQGDFCEHRGVAEAPFQRASFAERLATTHRVTRALSFLSQRYPGWRARDVQQALSRTARWLRNKQDERGPWGAFGEEDSTRLTALALDTLLDTRVVVIDPAVRRACRYLVAAGRDKMGWGAAGDAQLAGVETLTCGLSTTASMLWSLMRSHSIEWDVLEAGMAHLVSQADPMLEAWSQQATGMTVNPDALDEASVALARKATGEHASARGEPSEGSSTRSGFAPGGANTAAASPQSRDASCPYDVLPLVLSTSLLFRARCEDRNALLPAKVVVAEKKQAPLAESSAGKAQEGMAAHA